MRFKEDKLLEASGLNRDWPEGRGIFHNNDKTFLVLINDEDHLQIVSRGTEIGAIFSRIVTVAGEIDKVAKFEHDTRLGYITSCPTNLGTALHVSFHVALPNLGKAMKEFQ